MENKEAPREREQTIILDMELYKKLSTLADIKGIDVSAQIKFILWDYFDSQCSAEE